MANENAKIVRQQGGSEISVRSAGSLNIEAGGVIGLTGVQTVNSTGSLTVASGGALTVGGVRIHVGRNSPLNTLAGSPGDIFFRSDGSVSNLYVNQASGVSGQTWASAVEA